VAIIAFQGVLKLLFIDREQRYNQFRKIGNLERKSVWNLKSKKINIFAYRCVGDLVVLFWRF